jgi:hypothetical protein
MVIIADHQTSPSARDCSSDSQISCGVSLRRSPCSIHSMMHRVFIGQWRAQCAGLGPGAEARLLPRAHISGRQGHENAPAAALAKDPADSSWQPDFRRIQLSPSCRRSGPAFRRSQFEKWRAAYGRFATLFTRTDTLSLRIACKPLD